MTPRNVAAHRSSLLFLFLGLSAAQQCFYPDGSASTDIPCRDATISSCCPEASYCMDNGLCFGGGVMSRGSCTDKSWEDDACTTFCRTNSPNMSETIIPCANGDASDPRFACRLSASACQDDEAVFSLNGTISIIPRASQVQALRRQATDIAHPDSSLNSTACLSLPDGTPLFTGGALAGLGLGLGIPLLMALAALFFLLRRQRARARGPKRPKLMYRLPDNHEEFEFRATRPRRASDVTSLRTVTTLGTETAPPAHMKTFLERYQAMSEKGKSQVPAVELPGSMMAHELADRRRSDYPAARVSRIQQKI